MEGWIRLHRKIRNNEIFNNHQLLRLWLICLTEATHKERDQIIGKQTVRLMPGQFVTGRFDIADLYNMGLKPSDRVKGEKTVFRWLENLEEWGFLTLEKTNKFTVVTIEKWGFYQSNVYDNDQQNDHEMTNKRPTNDQQMTTNKNVKNYLSTTTANDEEEETLGSVYTKVFKTLTMDGLTSDFFMNLRNQGYTERFCIELLLEAGETSQGKPSLRYLKTICDRWIKENIYTRQQAKVMKTANNVKGIPVSPIPVPKPVSVSDEELRRLEEMDRRAAERNRASNQ